MVFGPLVIRPIVFCKAPVPGRVKTRLQPDFTPRQAARIHAAMAELTVERVQSLFPQAWLATDDPAHPFFRRFALPILPQGPGDLGQRMQRLMLRAVEGGARGVLLLGTDSPHMHPYRLVRAVRLLARYDAVLGPVEDGGYDLLALRGAPAGVFEQVRWGTGSVLTDTLRRLAALGLRRRCLSIGFDVDTAADLERMLRSLEAEPASPPLALLRRLGTPLGAGDRERR